MEMSALDCGKKQPYRQNDMSDSSRYLYGHLPPDIMPKGFTNNGNDTMVICHARYNFLCAFMKDC